MQKEGARTQEAAVRGTAHYRAVEPFYRVLGLALLALEVRVPHRGDEVEGACVRVSSLQQGVSSFQQAC